MFAHLRFDADNVLAVTHSYKRLVNVYSYRPYPRPESRTFYIIKKYYYMRSQIPQLNYFLSKFAHLRFYGA